MAKFLENCAAGSFVIEPADFLGDACSVVRGAARTFTSARPMRQMSFVRRQNRHPLRNGIGRPATAIRELAERWKVDGCKAFDEADTPAGVAEAAGKLRCALELSHLLDALERGTTRFETRAVRAPERRK